MTGLRQIVAGLCFCTQLFCMTGDALAETVSDLYVAEVPVAGQSDAARSAAVREAFAEVLVKVSGDRDLPLRGKLRDLLSRANSYVQQYGYRMPETAQGASAEAATGNAAPDRLLRVRFEEQAVNRELRQSGVPVWSSIRPSVLIWLGLEQNGHRSLYQPEQDPGLGKALEETARERGMPILLPLMDLEDTANLRVSDVWGSFEEAIRQASDRYLPDVILVGRLRQRGGSNWTADWTLYLPGEVSNWQTSAAGKWSVARQGLERAVDRLAQQFAPRSAEQGSSTLRIRVSGLVNLADYILVKEYLESLGLIDQLDLMAAHPESISFIARVQGGRDALEKGIMLGGVLEPVVAADEVVRADAASPASLDAESLDFRLRQ